MSYLERCIVAGIRNGWDVSWFVKEEWNGDQLLEVRWGLEGGLDVSKYAKKEFNWRQMAEIRSGIKQGLDVSVYAKKEFDWEEMVKRKRIRPHRPELQIFPRR